MKKSLGRKAAALFMAAIMGVASSVCTPSMAVKAESATVTDAEEEIVDVQEEQVEQTDQTAEDEELIDIEVMAGDVPIDSAHFPDERFRNIIKERYDTNKNGILSDDEISQVDRISVLHEGISSIQGVEYFYNLKDLQCQSNNLGSIDISKNTKLEILSCNTNNLTNIDVSKNPNLYDLDCARNKISNLDVSNNLSLIDITCWGNNLANLDVSKNTKLAYLDCRDNYLSNLDISKNKNLCRIFCENNNLRNLDVSNQPNLELLDCSNNYLNLLNVSSNTNLEDLRCTGNNIENLDISKNSILCYLKCDEKVAKNLNFERNKELEMLVIPIKLENMKYDLAKLPWVMLDKIGEVYFKYYDKGFYYDDDSSYMEGSIANIGKYKKGSIEFNKNNTTVLLQYDEMGNTLTESALNPGILVMIAGRNYYVAGLATSCSDADKKRLEYSWVAQDSTGNFILMSDWNKNEWVNWTPDKFGTYTIFAKVRVDGKDDQIYTTVGQYDYHPYIKGKCQLPYSAVAPGQPGYLIGVESYENPNQSYQFEMLILDCTLLAQGLPAWTYTTGKFTVPEGNAGWCVWNPQYGYYWTLFRIYDGAGNLIDEYCYPFVNAY